jgi:hypothetical protein
MLVYEYGGGAKLAMRSGNSEPSEVQVLRQFRPPTDPFGVHPSSLHLIAQNNGIEFEINISLHHTENSCLSAVFSNFHGQGVTYPLIVSGLGSLHCFSHVCKSTQTSEGRTYWVTD